MVIVKDQDKHGLEVMPDENPKEEAPKLPTRSHFKDALFGWVFGALLVGFGLFRYGERPVMGFFFVTIGVVNLIFGTVNFVLWLDERAS